MRDWQTHLEREWFRWVESMGFEAEERSRAEACVAQLEPEAFTGPRSALFRACKAIVDAGAWPSLATILERARDPEVLRAIGGHDEIHETFARALTHHLPPDVCLGIEPVTRWLRDEHERRRQAAVLVRAQVALAEGREGDVEPILDELHAIAEADSEHDYTAQDLVHIELARMTSEHALSKATLRSGLDALDNAIDWNPGDLIFIGGDTGHGKSATMLAIFDGFARNGIRTGYISLEDGEDVLAPRMTALVTGISKEAFHGKRLEALPLAMRSVLDEASRDARTTLPVHTIRKDASLAEVRRIMTRHVRRHGCQVLAVDYIHAIKSKVRGDQRRHELATFASEIKAHAHRLGVPLLVGAQLRRIERGAVPGKRDLRDCGELEEKAEGVLIAWRTPVERGVANRVLIAAKVKNGASDFWLELDWDAGTVRGLRRMSGPDDFAFGGERLGLPDDFQDEPPARRGIDWLAKAHEHARGEGR